MILEEAAAASPAIAQLVEFIYSFKNEPEPTEEDTDTLDTRNDEILG